MCHRGNRDPLRILAVLTNQQDKTHVLRSCLMLPPLPYRLTRTPRTPVTTAKKTSLNQDWTTNRLHGWNVKWRHWRSDREYIDSISCCTTMCNRRTARGPLRGVQVPSPVRSLDQLHRFLTTSVVGAHAAGTRNLLCARVRIPRWGVFVCTRTLACRASNPPCQPSKKSAMYDELLVLDALTDEEMAALDMFRALVMLGVVGKVARPTDLL